MNEKLAVEALRQVKEIFDKHGIEFWLDFGTLLGAVRDGKFIPWDHDIDLGAWSEECIKIESACKELQDKGFETKIDISSVIPLHVIIRGKYTFDIFLYHLKYKDETIAYTLWDQPLGYFLHHLQWMLSRTDKDLIYRARQTKEIPLRIAQFLPLFLKKKLIQFIWWLLSVKMKDLHWSKYYRVTVPSRYFQNLSTIKFYDMEFKIPIPMEDYLIYRYGENWRIPKEDYKYHEDR